MADTIMRVINYIGRLQAMDKALSLLYQLRDEQRDLEIDTVLELETQYNQAPSAKLFFEFIGEISTTVFIVGQSPIHDEAARVLRETSCRVEKVSESALIRRVNQSQTTVDRLQRLFRPSRCKSLLDQIGDRTALVMVRNADQMPVARALRKRIVESGGRVFRYFKSIHDKDTGLTADRQRHTQVRSSINGHDEVMTAPDMLLVHSESFKRLLESLGRARQPMAVIGYPLLFPAWQQRIRTCSAAQQIMQMRSELEVSMLIRGEIAKRPPEQQVMPHTLLTQIMHDTLAELDALGRSYRVRIKPHPNQDVQFVRSLVENRSNVSITYDPPALLAATADVVVTTYTSSIIDALGFGVPCIDYYEETEGFRYIHPGGYPFEQFGVLRARNRDEFRQQLHRVLAPGYQPPDVRAALEHRMDLSVFCARLSQRNQEST